MTTFRDYLIKVGVIKCEPLIEKIDFYNRLIAFFSLGLEKSNIIVFVETRGQQSACIDDLLDDRNCWDSEIQFQNTTVISIRAVL